MKTKILLYFLLSPFSFLLVSAQVPQGFNYQAIARDVSGDPLVNYGLQVKLTVKPDSSGTGVIWEEIHNPVTTNAFGLFTVVLGKGSRQATSAVQSFSNIDWSIAPKFVRTDIYYNGGWKLMGITRLWSVPYALSVASPLKLDKLAVTGSTTSADSVLFEVKNKSGQTIFAVYNEGVRIYVDDGVGKGTKGGFAIGGFGTTKGTSQPLFVVDADSIRAYIGTNPGKGIKGGFAIGGFSTTKAPGEEYLRVTRDSARMNIHQPAKGQKGGFAIGGFSTTKGAANYFLDMTPLNYFIGDSSGARTTTGLFNSFIGYKTGPNNTAGANNAFFGYQSGYKNTSGNSNLFVGYQSGYNNKSGSFNSFVGYQAGYNNTSGINNTFLGSYSSVSNTVGSSNTSVGYFAGYSNNSGNENSFIGYNSGAKNTIGSRNVFIGPEAGYNTIGGTDNIFTGVRAGYMFIAGSRNICIGTEAGWQSYSQGNITSDNIFIGYQAGNPGAGSEYMNSPGNGNIWIGKYAGWNLGSQWYNAYMKDATPPLPPLMNTLVIDNNDHINYVAPPPTGPDLTHYPLIFGNFSYEVYRRCVVINGVNNHGYTFFVNGSSGSYGAWGVSDEREKENITPIPDALNKVLSLRGVNFEWKDTVRGGTGQQMGFIAQEAIKIVPEVVQYRNNFYTMNYSALTALFAEAMKEQHKIIEDQKAKLLNQDEEIKSLKSRMEQIESLLSRSGIR